MEGKKSLKNRIHEVIFEADTKLGKQVDILIMVLIVLSVIVVLLETVPSLDTRFGKLFYVLEWSFTVIFTIEYILRLYSLHHPWKYAKSFYGIIDFLAIVPTYLSIIFAGSQYFLVVRMLRLMRVFRIFRLGQFMKEGTFILSAMQASRAKISVFLFFVLIMVTIIGSVMYLVEGSYPDTPFTSIPISIYWAIVTLTTVGFGDIVPQTGLGKFLSAVVMILGYAVIAVPTGIVSAELIDQQKEVQKNTQACRACGQEGHDDDAKYCKYCGSPIYEEGEEHPVYT